MMINSSAAHVLDPGNMDILASLAQSLLMCGRHQAWVNILPRNLYFYYLLTNNFCGKILLEMQLFIPLKPYLTVAKNS